MREMIERVAQAICLWDGMDWDGPLGGRECSRKRYRDMASAAIKAMREPTEEMIDAAYEAVEFNDRWQIEDLDDYRKAHHAMIDAALSITSGVRKSEA